MAKLLRGIPEEIREGIEWIKILYEAVEGKKDVKSRVDVLANPSNIKTMSNLSPSEVEFCSQVKTIVQAPEWGPMFEGLSSYADEKLEFVISKRGTGRTESIQFVGAINELQQLKKLGLSLGSGAQVRGGSSEE